MMKLSVGAVGCLALSMVLISVDALSPPVLIEEHLDLCFPITMCKCPYGTTWSIDGNGCPRCSCKPKPPCPMYKCAARDCPHGMAKDAKGCPTCECATGPICPEPFCPFIKCANGLVTDANGCKICRCKPFVCPAVLCAAQCRNGYITDSNGCNTCKCKPTFPICPPLCRMHCPNGFVRDSNGCPICKCKPFKPVCPPVCMIYCEHGNVLDSNGCPTCKCKEGPTCPPILCPAIACPLGYENDKDRNGCRIGCGCRKIGLPEM